MGNLQGPFRSHILATNHQEKKHCCTPFRYHLNNYDHKIRYNTFKDSEESFWCKATCTVTALSLVLHLILLILLSDLPFQKKPTSVCSYPTTHTLPWPIPDSRDPSGMALSMRNIRKGGPAQFVKANKILKSRIYTWTTLVHSTVALKNIKCVCRKNMMMQCSSHVTDSTNHIMAGMVLDNHRLNCSIGNCIWQRLPTDTIGMHSS
jgi:hypothetical protein